MNPNEIYNDSEVHSDTERMLAAIAMQLHRIAQALEKSNEKPPECAHGPRVRKTGEKDGKPWAMWACPLPQERKDERCVPLWED